MICRLARYTVRPGAEAAVEEAARAFVAEIRRSEPTTVYRVLRLDGGRDFEHYMAFPDPAAGRRHDAADYTRRFLALIEAHCETPPRLHVVETVAAAEIGPGEAAGPA